MLFWSWNLLVSRTISNSLKIEFENGELRPHNKEQHVFQRTYITKAIAIRILM